MSGLALEAVTPVVDAPSSETQRPRKSPRLSGLVSIQFPQSENSAPASSGKGVSLGGKKKRASLSRFGWKKRSLPLTTITAPASSEAADTAPFDLLKELNDTIGDLDEVHSVLGEKVKVNPLNLKEGTQILQSRVQQLKGTLNTLMMAARKLGPEVFGPLQEEINGRLGKLADEASTQRGIAERAEGELGGAHQKAEERKQRITELEAKADALRGELTELTERHAGEVARAEAAEASLATRDWEVEEATSRLEEKSATLAAMTDLLQQEQEDRATADQKLQQVQEYRATAEQMAIAAADEARQERQQRTTAEQAWEERATAAEQATAAAQVEIEQLRTELTALRNAQHAVQPSPLIGRMHQPEAPLSIQPDTPWNQIAEAHTAQHELEINNHVHNAVPQHAALISDVMEKFNDVRGHDPDAHDFAQALTDSELVAIIAYTHDFQLPDNEKRGNLYFEMNEAMRASSASARKQMMSTWGLTVHYILNGLEKLPDYAGTVLRGVTGKARIAPQYTNERLIKWRAFSSSSTSLDAAADFGALSVLIFMITHPVPDFTSVCIRVAGTPDDVLIFRIQVTRGKVIRLLSLFAQEDEVLLFPGMKFKVTRAAYVSADGYTYVDLAEDAPMLVF